MELIDRAALLKKSYYRGRPATVNHPWGDGAEVVDVEDIEAMPTIDAVLLVHGRWIHHYHDSGKPIDDKWYCSECHMCNDHKRTWYCPNCGAKMDLEEIKND